MSESTKLDPKIWRVIAVVMLGPLMAQMDSTIVNVSISAIGEDLQAPIASAQWIVSGYLLALALMLPLNGWLVDRVGAKRLYLVCFAAFTAASVLCGAAHTLEQLIGARLLQGVAGGLLAPLTQMMMARVAGKQLARAIGYGAVPVLLAPLLGPIVAGAILQHAGWPWLFYVNLPVGILAVVLAAVLLPRDDVVVARRPFDVIGFMTISPGLACVLYGLDEFAHDSDPVPLLVGLGLLAAFLWHAHRKQSSALVDLGLFKNRVFATASITQFLSNGITYAGQFLVPLYLITGVGMSATEAGWVLAPTGLGMLCIYPAMGFLTERFGCRAVVATGVIVNLVATLPFLLMIEKQFVSSLALVCLFFRGAGQGAVGIPSIAAAYAAVPREKLGGATTAINIVQRLGGPVATTTIAITMSLVARRLGATGPGSFLMPFVVLLALQLVIIGSASRLPVRIEPA